MSQIVKWTEIENFHTLRRELQKFPELLPAGPVVMYCAKVKLHGTNAGVRIDPDGTVTAQSRTQVITPASDNCGFARWVDGHREHFSKLAGQFPKIVYGEWCGPGIQKGVAVSSIPKKIFAVFAIRVLNSLDTVYTGPEALEATLEGIPDVHVLPWYNGGQKFTLDWSADSDLLQPSLDEINARVADVEKKDPWVHSVFGVEGVGEGLVFYALDGAVVLTYKHVADLMFKAKGEKHAVTARTKPAQSDPTVAANLDAFIDIVLTPARLEQGAMNSQTRDCRGLYDVRDMGNFLKWITSDVLRECRTEREAAGIDEKTAANAVMKSARNWYSARSKTI
jgi:hypothetical protein